MTDIESLWRNQKTEETVTLENIHLTAEKFQGRIRTALLIEYVGSYIWVLPGSMVKAGAALIIVGALFMVWQLHRRMAARRVPDLSAPGLLEFHKRELLRQRDAAQSAWLWYMLPCVPGMALLMLGRWYQFHVPSRSLAWDHEVIVLGGIIAVLIFGIVRLLQVVRVGRLQRKIDELDKLQ